MLREAISVPKLLIEKAVYKVKSLGIVRKVDELGRIVLPMELRRLHDIAPRDSLEIFTEGDNIILKKYEPQCVFCSNSEEMKTFKGKNVCVKCLKEALDQTKHSD